MPQPLRLHVLSLALAMGIVVAIMMFVFSVIAWTTGLWADTVGVIGTAYLGYAPTLAGSFIGALWGFADGFVFEALVAWLNNMFAGTFPEGKSASDAA